MARGCITMLYNGGFQADSPLLGPDLYGRMIEVGYLLG